MKNPFSSHDGPLRVGIIGDVDPGKHGGIASVLAGLVHSLGRLDDGEEEYIIIGNRQNAEWLKAYTGANQKIVVNPVGFKGVGKGAMVEAVTPVVRWLREHLLKALGVVIPPEVLISSGYFEQLGCDVIHFLNQSYTVCAVPTVYNPHDLQHLHLPHFFAPYMIAWRERMYRTGCQLSNTVVAGSQWVARDIVKNYAVSPDKVQVIPWAAPTQAYRQLPPRDLATVRHEFQLPEKFAFYPAMTWPHKNHLGLLEALALLRNRDGIRVNLVCTGYKTAFWPKIVGKMLELGIQDQAQFLGMVRPEILRCVYQLAEFVIVPTLFEAASGPVFEAWLEGTPVACSNVTSLPEQVGDGALVFDPSSVDSIADAAARMTKDNQLRSDLRERGANRLQDFSWERTAKAYRAVYRRAAGWGLSEEDHWLLSWDWMSEPDRHREAGA